tara:strand:- start:1421 stop:1576 length:156 start_codon:yes stop_codon:yes gene_type:complete
MRDTYIRDTYMRDTYIQKTACMHAICMTLGSRRQLVVAAVRHAAASCDLTC